MKDVEWPANSSADLQEAVARLPRLQREAFLMAARDRLSYSAIAQRLRVSRHGVARLITKALVQLDRALDEIEG